MGKINRRKFVAISALAAAALTCLHCSGKKPAEKTPGENQKMTSKDRADLNKGMTKEEIMTMLDQRVDQYIRRCGNCAQSSFMALSEQFGLENKEILKALTPLPGIAETGSTCGVITGSLMVMGLLYGRNNLDDWQKYRDSLVPTGKFVETFKKEMGSTYCSDIVEKEFGKRLDLRNPDDHAEFVAGDPGTKCGNVAKKGVNIAASIILADQHV